MGLVTRTPASFVSGAPIASADVNQNLNDLYNEFNGLIDNDNIKPAAGIEDTKLAQITAPAKVDASTALTGLIPSASQDKISALVDGANVPTVASASTIFTLQMSSGTATRQLDNPSAAVAGMKRVWKLTQDNPGGQIITFGTEFRFISGLTFVASTGTNAVDYIGAIYDGTNWDVIATSKAIS